MFGKLYSELSSSTCHLLFEQKAVELMKVLICLNSRKFRAKSILQLEFGRLVGIFHNRAEGDPAPGHHYGLFQPLSIGRRFEGDLSFTTVCAYKQKI